MNLKELEKQFACPDGERRAMPFWAWNGELEEAELLRQIDVMKEMGFGGFYMHSRTGLGTEYLGEEWFRLIDKCAEYGTAIGMEPWLYDEDRWPSGSAGGLVTKEEAYRSLYLVMEKQTPEDRAKQIQEGTEKRAPEEGEKQTPEDRAKQIQEGTEKRAPEEGEKQTPEDRKKQASEGEAPQRDGREEEPILVYACRLDGTSYTQGRPLAPGEMPAPEETVLFFYARHPEGNDNYNGYTYLDTMNREAVQAYIRSTHEAYKDACGSRFGKSIKGIFTDEPHRGGLLTHFSEGEEWAVPYTPMLLEQFEERFGYDLRERLPELFLRKDGQELSKTTWDYIELCQELFLENFAKPIYQWCEENGLEFTGHVLHEDNLVAQTVMQGALMRFYEYMHRPGVDVLGMNNQAFWIAKQIQSVARQQQKKWVLSELNGCTGWQTSLDTYKNIGDWQRLFGINFRCPHLSWYTMKGEAKRDYPASILHQSTWFREYETLETYYARLGVLLDGGEPECGLLVVSPIESVWARAYSGAFKGLSARDAEIQRLERQYAAVFHSLADRRIDFDYGDEDHIARFGAVEEGQFKLGACRYRKILVAGCDTIRSTTLDLLNQFLAQGGTVIVAGEIPKYVDAVPSDAAGKMAEKAVRIPFDAEEIAGSCGSGREIRVSGQGDGEIFAQVVQKDGLRIVALLNRNREQARERLAIGLGAGKRVERWDARTGRRFLEKAELADGGWMVETDFGPGEFRIYVIPQEDSIGTEHSGLPRVCGKGKRIPVPERREWAYRLDEPNIFVLDMVTVTLPDGRQLESQEVLKAGRSLRETYGYPPRGGDMLQPWYAIKYREGAQEPLCKAKLRYEFEVQSLPERDILLVTEDLENISRISVNGTEIARAPLGTWVDICFQKLSVSRGLLKKGTNEIVMEMDYIPINGLEAIYLLGEFGVWRSREGVPEMGVLPEKLLLEDIAEQGLLFYSGKIVYHMEMPETVKGKSVILKAAQFGGSCIRVKGGGREALLPWQPYEEDITELAEAAEALEVEVILTRRNTFGPLHQLPALVDGYGPGNFLSKGDRWSDGYVTLPQGLLGQPEFYERKGEME